MSDVAVYVVIKYVDDLERQEALNVGIVLGTGGELLAKFADRDDRRVDAGAVRRFEELITDLIAREVQSTKEGQLDATGFLHELADRAFSHFVITQPRQITLAGDPEGLVVSLGQRLVTDRVSTTS
jgi:Protein of unknown function (DUF3037)